MRPVLNFRFAAYCGFALAAIVNAAQAQSYPVKPIRLIVPYAAGGSTDALARAVGQKLGDSFGQQVLVDNRTGANGNIGTDHDAVVKILTTPEMKERFLTTIGGDPVGGTPEQFASDIKSDIARWAKIVKNSGIKLE